MMRIFFLIASLILLSACRDPLSIKGEGDIVERLAGIRGCTLEEFQAGSPRCTDNQVVGEAYKVSYEAIPRPGWVFVRWEGGLCARTSEPGFCDYDFEKSVVELVDATWPGFPFAGPTAVFKRPQEAAVDVFEAEVATPVVASRCAACHIEGGISGFTRLVFEHRPTADQNQTNIDAFKNFVTGVEDGGELLLTKVRGGAGHGGGSVFSAASDEYKALESFLSLVQGETPENGETASEDFWTDVAMADAEKTLRRAAIIVGGRAPTAAEKSQAASGEAGLRAALLGLMQGDGFHQFLVEGANDRLLTDGLLGPVPEILLLPGSEYFPDFNNAFVDTYLEEGEAVAYEELAKATFGLVRSPSELIAWVVEQDRPYTEILTADYALMNPALANSLNTSLDFDDAGSAMEFKPGRHGQALVTGSFEAESLGPELTRFNGSWELAPIPHAGVLTTYAFLERYPTTETNRNRARSRWTYYHFLGVDIEKSAGRTTDPAALADTDNPTLKNPNCAVCHQIMDPVAGAFQNFGNQGLYRESFGGTDSLPDTYRYPEIFDPDAEPSGYQQGDTWFRDMRPPGFDGELAPDKNSSLPWLARQIVADPRFAEAAVKFWWPALMGSPVLEAPEIIADANYASKLQAYEAQQTSIAALASGFREHYNLRQLLADMLLSPWFRADSGANLSAERQLQLATAGVERLLTPEQLERKIAVLAGYKLEPIKPIGEQGYEVTRLTDRYKIFLGGIDSGPVNERATVSTSIITQSLQAVALSSACGIVSGDYLRPTGQRYLFQNVDMTLVPPSDPAINNADSAAIKAQIQHLHSVLLGEELTLEDAELQASYELMVGSLQDYAEVSFTDVLGWDQESRCWFPNDVFDEIPDPNHVLKAWSAVVAYLMMDYRFAHE